MPDHPAKPRLALTVGVIGHRPNRLPETARTKVEVEIGAALNLLREAAEAARSSHADVFAEERPSLRVLSALAEGADRVAADTALEAGYSLTCILPFPADDYEQDFIDEASRAHFRALLARAETVLTLPGARADTLQAYETAGHLLLQNVDLVLAVWDGGLSAGRGGTTELVERAARSGLPIVHIDAAGEATSRVLWSHLGAFPTGDVSSSDVSAASTDEMLSTVVNRIVRPPAGRPEATKLSRFFAEAWKPWNWRMESPLLLGLIGVRTPGRNDLRPLGPQSLATQFTDVARFALPTSDREVVAPVGEAFGWADALGSRYAQIFRGAYIANFVLAGLAVAMAAGSLIGTYIVGWPKWPFVLIEIAFIVAIVANTRAGWRRDWHGRWLETREVAERLRAGLLLWLLAQRPHASPGDEPTWTGWYVRAQFRAIGIRSGVMDGEGLSAVRDVAVAAVEDQRRYHAVNAERMHKVEHRVELIGTAFFVVTLAVAVLYVAGVAIGLPTPSWWSYTVTALTAGLPALGAATFGIRLIGDFADGAERSKRTGAALAAVAEHLKDAPLSLAGLSALARAASDAMMGDVSHWRLTSETRPLAIPG